MDGTSALWQPVLRASNNPTEIQKAGRERIEADVRPRIHLTTILCAAALLLSPATPQQTPPEGAADDDAEPQAESPGDNTEPAPDSDRTTLNLLGEVDSEKGESRRNENVRITLIDNNVLRELTTRMGTTATVTPELQIDQTYFAAEFGQPTKRPSHQPASSADAIHGNLYLTHQNSVFSAR